MWIDTHCHLQIDERDSADIVARATEADVEKLICVGTDLNYSHGAIAEAEKYDNVFATVGLHPHEATHGLDGLEELISHPKVVGIGECGLDYYYEHSPKDVQREVFAQQIAWCTQYDKTLVIHTRDAWDDTVDVLTTTGVPERVVLHCFTGGPQEAKRLLDLGAYISISGIATFKNAENIREAIAIIPTDRLLVETDAPWLAPVPFRGKENEPAWVSYVGQCVAEVKNLPLGEISTATIANTERVFTISRYA